LGEGIGFVTRSCIKVNATVNVVNRLSARSRKLLGVVINTTVLELDHERDLHRTVIARNGLAESALFKRGVASPSRFGYFQRTEA